MRGGLKILRECFNVACDVMSILLKSLTLLKLKMIKMNSQDGDSDSRGW